MKEYEAVARTLYAPLLERYALKFVAQDSSSFFLIGNGFALQIILDPRDGEETWYISIDNSGNVLKHKLMYLMVDRFTKDDAKIYGKPTSLDDRMYAEMRTDAVFLLNKCQDILSGDKSWLLGYQDKGDYNNNVAKFLAPYFQAQGYPVMVKE
jgi:hypothetical protein